MTVTSVPTSCLFHTPGCGIAGRLELRGHSDHKEYRSSPGTTLGASSAGHYPTSFPASSHRTVERECVAVGQAAASPFSIDRWTCLIFVFSCFLCLHVFVCFFCCVLGGLFFVIVFFAACFSFAFVYSDLSITFNFTKKTLLVGRST